MPEEKPGVKEARRILRENRINWIDTAQAYGSGESERIRGELFARHATQKLYHPDEVVCVIEH